jgi:hypothetical protein
MENTTTTSNNTTQSGNSGFHYSDDALKKTSEKVSEYFGAASEELKKFESMIKKNVDKNPVLVLGGALVAGYLVGYLMRRLSTPSPYRANSLTR